ncbi:MAG: hypothetical protein N2690_00405 [Rhodocyclaceae bacterium]|nr:hypothetical protein [Rhodocyclaceae bacterium]
MRLTVLKGVLHHQDRARKGAHRAVLLGKKEGAVLLAPCTTYYGRRGIVPPGHVLVNSQNCPSFEGTGFDQPNILIGVRDAFFASPRSPWAVEATQIGVLDLSKATRVQALMAQAIKEFPQGASCMNNRDASHWEAFFIGG